LSRDLRRFGTASPGLDAGGIDWRRTFLIRGYVEKSLTPHAIEAHRIRKVVSR
jgi:hypothetical protein